MASRSSVRPRFQWSPSRGQAWICPPRVSGLLRHPSERSDPSAEALTLVAGVTLGAARLAGCHAGGAAVACTPLASSAAESGTGVASLWHRPPGFRGALPRGRLEAKRVQPGRWPTDETTCGACGRSSSGPLFCGHCGAAPLSQGGSVYDQAARLAPGGVDAGYGPSGSSGRRPVDDPDSHPGLATGWRGCHRRRPAGRGSASAKAGTASPLSAPLVSRPSSTAHAAQSGADR
jgi:hypothetical protein